MPSDTDISDPWDWSVDRVVQELCTENRSWQLRSSSMRAPDFASLERSLREQEVSGSVLLINVNDSILKEDFGIKVLGHRAFVLSAIDRIRMKSAQYHAHKLADQPEPVPSETGRGLAEILQHYIRSLPSPIPPPPNLLDHSPLVNGAYDEVTLTTEPENKRQKLDLINPGSEDIPQFGEDSDHQILQPVEDNRTPTSINPESPTIQDINEKKRKRIAPMLISSEIDPNLNRDIPSAADDVVIHHEPGVTFLGKDGKKRMVPIRQAAAEDQHHPISTDMIDTPSISASLGVLGPGIGVKTSRNKVTSSILQNSTYLGRKKFPVDAVFYDKVPVGQEIPILDDNLEFYLPGHKVSKGRKLYVHSRMKHFLRERPMAFTKNDEKYRAIIPYNTKLTPRFQKPTFTLFHIGLDKRVTARREEVHSWQEVDPEGKVYQGDPDRDGRLASFNVSADLLTELGSYENWDPSSLEKYKYLEGGDEILPLYGESDEENEFDGALWDEIEKERAERGQKLERTLGKVAKNQISNDEVNEAIDEEIAELVARWRTKVLPKRQEKAWKIWRKSRRDKNKREEINKAEERRKHIEKRIAKQRAEILLDIWTSKLQVRKQTRIMEISVFEQQDLNWRISLLEQKSSPEKLPSASSVVSSKKAVSYSDDGESVGSEDEAVSSDDGLDSFIVEEELIPTIEEERFELNLADSENDSEVDDAEMSDASLSVMTSATPTFKRPPISSIHNANPTRSDTESFSHDLRTPRVKNEEVTMHNPPKTSTKEIIDLTTSSDERSTPKRTFNFITPKKLGPSTGSTAIVDLTTPDKKLGEKRIHLINRDSPFRKSSLNGNPAGFSKDGSPDLDNLPPYDDPAAIATYGYSVYEERMDPTRLLIKLFYHMKPGTRSSIFASLSKLSEQDLWRKMKQVRDALLANSTHVQGMDNETYHINQAFIRIFLMYVKCQHVPLIPLSKDQLKEVINAKLEHFSSFYKLCCRIEGYFGHALQAASPSAVLHKSKIGSRMMEEEEQDDDDDDDESQLLGKRPSRENTATDDDIVLEDSRRKKRKKVNENAAARRLRDQDKERLAKQEERRKKLHMALEASGQSFDENRSRIIINDAAAEDQGHIYVHEKIGKRIKKHQIEGVRFLWNQIVTPVDEDKMQGCLLAHTMGLGKTMQTITLLVAIAEATQSNDKSISSQIPESLRVSRTLVLCPPGLIDNWMDELLTWVPDKILGELRKVDSVVAGYASRLDTISSWYDAGGVLVLGYEMFRILINNVPTPKRGAPLTDEQHEQVKNHILGGSNIIIADEAHKLKNGNASVTEAAALFRSKSRIALTGSPLANKVEEYYSMIEWVAPNYLGPLEEFRATYANPIQNGLWSDSLAPERRKSLKMLDVLKETLAPKVHRADMSVLKDDLPPKTEFVITVPLTDIQKKAYSIYVQCMLKSKYIHTKDGDIQSATLWSWLSVLTLLCNHPQCFMAKLEERIQDAGSKTTEEDAPSPDDFSDLSETPALDLNAPLEKVDVSSSLIKQEKELFAPVADMQSIHLSYKARVLDQILDAAKAVGDKTLVFSQSIPTLNFLENMCREQGRKYFRLDGHSAMKKRQNMTKAFNNGNLEVFLISTTAGGLGLNLFGANRVVIFDFKYNPVQEEQAVGRAYRIGQKKDTFVYRFIAGGTFEEQVQNKTVFKLQLASRVVDKKRPVAWAKKKFSDFLFEPKAVEQKDLAEFKGMDPHVLDKILSNGIIRAIVQTDTFARDDNEKLTAEETREVEQLLSDEKIKRQDPEKWARLLATRVRQSVPNQHTQQNAHASLHHNVPATPRLGVMRFSAKPLLPPNASSNNPKPQSQAQNIEMQDLKKFYQKIVSSLSKASNVSRDDERYSKHDSQSRIETVVMDLQKLLLDPKIKQSTRENLIVAVSSALKDDETKAQALLAGRLKVDDFVLEVQRSLLTESSFESPEPISPNDITEVGTHPSNYVFSPMKSSANQILEVGKSRAVSETIRIPRSISITQRNPENAHLAIKKNQARSESGDEDFRASPRIPPVPRSAMSDVSLSTSWPARLFSGYFRSDPDADQTGIIDKSVSSNE